MSRQRPRRRGERPVIYGRDRERTQLRELVAEAGGGLGSLALISGEAGIGKTTLVDDLIYEARAQDFLVLVGGCYDLTTTPPYGPWSEALRGYTPQADQPSIPAWFGDPEAMAQVGSQTALFDEVRHFLTAIAEQQPLVIVLEDLHWADSASLEALHYLARSLSEVATLLVVSYRDDEITRRHELYQLLPLLVRESPVQRIHLHQLDRREIREMVASRYDLAESDVERLVEHVVERSEGNPFFAEEILHGLEDDQMLQPTAGGWVLHNLERAQVPMLLRQTLDTRLSRLSIDTRTALRVAAVIGQMVPIDLWQEITELDEDVFEQAMTGALTARVLEETANTGTLQFRHALIREALYESLTLSRRRAWHRAVGEQLAELPNADPEAVAHHFQASGDPRAAHWLIRSGIRAEGSYALRLAASHHDTAQALLEADPDAAQARGWLLLHIGHLLRYSDGERSIAYLEDAAHVARQVDDPVLAAHSLQNRGNLHGLRGNLGTGLEEMESAIAVMDCVTAADDERAYTAVTSLFPGEIFSHPEASSVGSYFKFRSLPGVNTLIHTYVDWLAFAGRFHDAMRIGKAFVDQVEAATDDPVLIQDACRDAYFGLATAADWLGRPEEAERWRTLALEAYEAVGHYYLMRDTQYFQLEHLIRYRTDTLADRRRVAAAVIAAGERAAGALQGPQSRPYGLQLDLLEGRWDRAHDLARMIVHEKQEPLAQAVRVWALRVLGRERADEEFTAIVLAEIQDLLVDGPATEPGRCFFAFPLVAQRLSAEVALDAGDLESARSWLAAHDRWLEWSGAILERADGHLLWARYHRLAGDLVAARHLAEEAFAYASDPRQPLALIAAHRCLGQLDTEAGHYDEAVEHFRASLELAERCEAPYEQALTKLALAELAVRRREINEARPLLRDVRAICESLDARRTLDRANQLMTQLSDRATSYPAGLSEREVEVLEQAATGMTNAEIGEALYISPRTVAQHLRSVYNKLGVNSRTAAVTRWAELNNASPH